ncbi:MAG TPA: antibiotic biosynthesis monooxygenase family protein [Pseudonocardiaceae bacterium]|jgi:heme-degrading monooxygenase HmoA
MSEPVTLINVFEVPADQVDAFVADWQRRADIMAAAPGFRDFRLHRALSKDSRFQLVNVAHWDSEEHLAAARSNPAFSAQIDALAQRGQAGYANPAVYEVVVERG